MMKNRIDKNNYSFNCCKTAIGTLAHWHIGTFVICLLCVVLYSCSNGGKATRTDTYTSGFAVFVSDDCFAPIVEEEINVFEALTPDASLMALYTSEVEAVNMLLKDSVRLAILGRDLTEAERQGIKARNEKLNPRSQKIAIDGIALIINKENTDSLISASQIQEIMTGGLTSWKQLNPQSNYDNIAVVFDNPNSSTVRFIKDSICFDKPLYEGLRAQETNQSVLDYVAKTPNALGVIGVNWISNPNDTTNLSFTDKIRVMSVSRSYPATEDNSYQPLPAFLALGDYPLTRDVYIVLTDLRGTLPAGFVDFVAKDRGQRIILKAGLVPATRPVRLIRMKDHL
ncbi:PstS family phosphate ABC transporter substrate-binding protein [Viscerimonas tarda]